MRCYDPFDGETTIFRTVVGQCKGFAGLVGESTNLSIPVEHHEQPKRNTDSCHFDAKQIETPSDTHALPPSIQRSKSLTKKVLIADCT